MSIITDTCTDKNSYTFAGAISLITCFTTLHNTILPRHTMISVRIELPKLPSRCLLSQKLAMAYATLGKQTGRVKCNYSKVLNLKNLYQLR